MNRSEEAKNRILDLIRSKTKTVGVELTTHCPLNCKYCNRKALPQKDREMSWENFYQLKERLADFDNIVLCGIGEPMVYSHIYDAVPLFLPRVMVITSGTVKIDYQRLDRSRNLDCVVFSVDLPGEEEMVRMTGNYNWANLQKNLKRNRFNARVAKVINCTVTSDNYHRLPDVVRFAAEHHLQAVSFTVEMKRECEPGEPAAAIPAEVKAYLVEASVTADEKGIPFSSSFTHIKCVGKGSIVPFVNLDGDVYPCCYGLNTFYKVGNIFDSTYDDIWENKPYEDFKQGRLCFDNCPVFANVSMGVTNEKH